jgi:hypothetical protein
MAVADPPRGRWRPLSEFVREHLPARGAPLRAGEPIGPYRLDFMFAKLRMEGRIEVRGRRDPVGKLVHLPRAEYASYIIHEATNRLEHVHSGLTLYDVQVRVVALPKADQRSHYVSESAILAALERYQSRPSGPASEPQVVEFVSAELGASLRAVRAVFQVRLSPNLKKPAHRSPRSQTGR